MHQIGFIYKERLFLLNIRSYSCFIPNILVTFRWI